MAAYLGADPEASPVMLLLGDALSPKGEWCGPYVLNRFASGYVAWPAGGKYLPFYNPNEPHARKFLGKKAYEVAQ